MLPFNQRRKIWDKYRTKARKQKTNHLNSDIVVGSQVCMKNSPLYQPGAIGMFKLKFYNLQYIVNVYSKIKKFLEFNLIFFI